MDMRKRNKENLSDLVENGTNMTNHQSNLKGDERNIALLFFLYTLQGIPLGLAAAIPMILQNRGISYKQQAEFSFVQWPFSLKLLWAPIVDSMYSLRIGRRKSWLIPTQYLIGLFMLLLSNHVDRWVGSDQSEPQIGLLTIIFFCLNFLAATQDIVVDGWALTMLKKKNVGHASTCNSVGQTTGFFFGYVLFLALESADFCNNYLRYEKVDVGIVTLSGFLFFWGCVFLVTTTLVAILKTEFEVKDTEHEHPPERDLKTAYTSLLNIIKLPAIQTLAIILLTCKVGFSSTDSVLTLKLIDAGIPKETLGLFSIPLVPLLIALPLVLAKYTSGPRPMDIYLRAMPYRLLFGIGAAGLVYVTPLVLRWSEGKVPFFWAVVLIGGFALHQICVYSMFVSTMAFFAKVSDPKVGGTYMTLLNTLSNLGGNWPQTLALWFVEPLTWKECLGDRHILQGNTCRDVVEKDVCTTNGGQCSIILDGYYVETFLCTIIGFVWILWGRKRITRLQSLDEQVWKIRKDSK